MREKNTSGYGVIPPGEGDVNLSPRRAAWVKGLGEEARKLLAEDERLFLRQSLSTPCLNVLASVRGSRLTDLDGREYLDFHGNSAHQLGYGHPAVLEALRSQLEGLSFCPRRYANRPAVELAQALTRLASLKGGGGGKVLFAPGGTTAVGMALKLARHATGRFKTISFWDSFHGASLDAISVGGEALFRSGAGPLLPGALHVPPPEPGVCRFRADGDCAACDLACAEYIAYVMEHEGDVGALIAEPVRCTALRLPPPGFWPRVREICDHHGALLIFDETAICLGRTGRMFACDHFGVAPDILTLGKGLGGGVLPMAAMLARSDLDVAADRALGHYTHEKSPLGAAVGLAVVLTIEAEGLLRRGKELGAKFLHRLEELRQHSGLGAVVAEVRGLGLALAVELRHPSGEKAARELADRALYGCLERGLSFKTSHGTILTLTPPLTISEEDLFLAADILEQSLLQAVADMKQ